MVFIELFTVVFVSQGIPEEKARFQVISLITGAGYTTKESEIIAKNNYTRRIAKILMISGYLGLATFISFFVKFINESFTHCTEIIVFIILVFLLWILKNKYFLKHIITFAKRINRNQMEKNNYKNIFSLLDKSNGYGIYHIIVKEDSLLIGIKLKESRLKECNIQVLNIDRGDEFIAFPSANDCIQIEDKLLLYGDIKSIKKFMVNRKKKI